VTLNLTRNTDKNTKRYYEISLWENLFGEYVVERIYGNCSYKTPTGMKKDFFDSYEKAIRFYNSIAARKNKKGYK